MPSELGTIGLALCATAIFAAALILKKFTRKQGASETYSKRPAIMTEAELKFFAHLQEAAPEYHFFPKVRVSDVIECRGNHATGFNQISQKHFDWVMCDKTSSMPIAAIELDDSTHSSTRSSARDAVKNSASKSARLPLIRFKWRNAYDSEIIRNSLIDALTLAQ